VAGWSFASSQAEKKDEDLGRAKVAKQLAGLQAGQADRFSADLLGSVTAAHCC
jgi:hypothetical protein